MLTLLVNRALGGGRSHELDQALRLLAAKHVGARRADAEGLRSAVVRRFVDGEAEAASSAAPAGEPLASFASRVVAAARASTTGRFGDHKVFISHVHRSLGDASLDLEGFKARLVDAQRAASSSSARADLVEAMAPADVEASETRYLGATFHFVRS